MTNDTQPKALITGSGRCGTKYLAEVLHKCYVNVGHEQWWSLEPDAQTPNLAVDISWIGCFDQGYTGPIYALVRNPADCIPSIYANEFTYPWSIIRGQNVKLTGDRAVDSCLIWCAYTETALRRSSGNLLRIEHLHEGRLRNLVESFGGYPDLVSEVLESTPKDVNTRPTDESFKWPNHPVILQILELAKYLGYDTDKIQVEK